ncbi:PREDICTED: uncharacterized protein LOC109330717 isoform X1 [Lupinus angustifolius]|uniref:uncharacterized protein LOC109330717 isoform X1 n=1 Tax=Lupinus angustifolius TaxID=3871 RepID=UPI00092F0CE4|nr:PREDICTED: uncharacterized protein LOC109330717 isoform X1 [Lupinus angustifolius]
MATTRLLRTTNPIHFPSSSSTTTSLFMRCVRYQSRASLNEDHNIAYGKSERKPVMAVKASMVTTNHLTTSQPLVRQGLLDLVAFITRIRNAMLIFLRASMKRKQWNLQPQRLIEKAIIDCRFFTLFAVAGTLLGSVLCFIEGCFLVIESYGHYFHTLSNSLDQGHLVHLLIEATDMFLIGTALLIFGVSLYFMFVGSRAASTQKESLPCTSNLLGHFYMKSAPKWVGMQTIEKAKSKIGHAVMMIVQVGVLDKFKDIPLVTGLDLACFAAAIFTSSASIFVLSRLHR